MAGPVVRFQAPELPPVADVAAYFGKSEQARWYSNGGPCYGLFIERVEGFLDGDVSCVATANATLALMVGLRALVGDSPSRQLVLMPSFTFAATALAARWAGLTPAFVDVERSSWHLCPEALARGLEARQGEVCAVLACSTFGMPPASEMTRRWELACQQAGVPLLVDSAAGFGAQDEAGRRLGLQGDAEVFSFHATKPFALGEGGLLSTRDPRLRDRVARLANFGFVNGVISDEAGLNAKLAEWPAATGLAVLDRFEEVIETRRGYAHQIMAEFIQNGFRGQAGAAGAVWQFVPLLAPTRKSRDAVLERARATEVEVRSYFSVPLHRMPAFAGHEILGSMACTEELAERVISLPMANDLSAEAIDRITSLAVA